MPAPFPRDPEEFATILVCANDTDLRLGRDEAGFYVEGEVAEEAPSSRDIQAGARANYPSREVAAQAAADRVVWFLSGVAASSLEARGAPRWPLESALERSLLAPLEGSDGVADARGFRDLPGWTPDRRPGAVDVIISYDGRLRVALELKLGAVGESLWDIVKLLNLVRADLADAAYVVVGAHDDEWAATPPGELFDPAQLLQPVDHDLAAFIRRSEKVWTSLLARSAGAPISSAATFTACLVADHPVLHYPGMSLRAVAVKPSSNAVIEFIDGWP